MGFDKDKINPGARRLGFKEAKRSSESGWIGGHGQVPAPSPSVTGSGLCSQEAPAWSSIPQSEGSGFEGTALEVLLGWLTALTLESTIDAIEHV